MWLRDGSLPVYGASATITPDGGIHLRRGQWRASLDQGGEELTLRRTDWNDLGQAVRRLVEARTGPVRAARTVSAGLNSQLAAVLDTENGPLFLKACGPIIPESRDSAGRR